MTRLLLVIAVAIALVGTVIWLVPDDAPPTPSSIQSWHASDPWVFGTTNDRYDYAGDAARRLDGGQLTLSVDPTTNTGSLDITLPADAHVSLLIADAQTPSETAFHQEISSDVTLWTDVAVHGDTGIGDAGLPETHAQIAGAGPVMVSVDGSPADDGEDWTAFWMLGDALRRDDGAIRNQGLIFSPLLRDRTGFSDPERTELTLLLHANATPESVILQMVFPVPVSSDVVGP